MFITRLPKSLVLVFGYIVLTADGVWAQCECGPHAGGGQRNVLCHVESVNPNIPLTGLESLASQAAGKWTTMFSQHSVPASIRTGGNDVRVILDPNIFDGQAYVTGDKLQMHIPEEWQTRTNPPFANDYQMAVILHEFGHVEGYDQSNCAGVSVMSNTNQSSYRTSFTNCDNQQFAYDFGLPPGEDPCQWGCPSGYTTNCQGDQIPDSCGCCVNYSPILLDRTGPPAMSSADNGPLFKINDQGSTLRVAWPLNSSSAFLVLDRNHNGTIDNGSELFGNTTRLSSGAAASNGYEALAEFDEDGDGIISAADRVFAELRLWRDRNRNGISEPDELSTLLTDRIRAISVQPKESEKRDEWGNRFKFRAKVWYSDNPPERFSYDVFPVAQNLDGSLACVGATKRLSTPMKLVPVYPPPASADPNESGRKASR